MNSNLVVSSSPHLKTPETTRTIMIDVLIGLFPVALAAVFIFGYRALVTMLIGMVVAMVTEAIILRKKDIFGDGSAAVTGLLLAMTLPPNPPWWMIAIGSVVAITIGKHAFGGIGNNIFNPALVGRAVLTVSWAGHMAGAIWPLPRPFDPFADIITGASPLVLDANALSDIPLSNLFFGNIAGCLGETSALALIMGGLWLFYRGHIDWKIPGGYMATVFIMGALLGGGVYENAVQTGIFHLLAGGVLLGALFMATDMVTSPVTKNGRLIFGIGCGVLTMVIRLYGSFPEGVTFAILLMNAVTPIIDKYTAPKKFGEVKKK